MAFPILILENHLNDSFVEMNGRFMAMHSWWSDPSSRGKQTDDSRSVGASFFVQKSVML